jgi:hypothetical protein
MNLGLIIKIGVIFSSVGISLFAILIAILLAFPVVKQCIPISRCTFSSTAPEPFLVLVNPGYASISLSCIAIGVLMFRLGIYFRDKRD